MLALTPVEDIHQTYKKVLILLDALLATQLCTMKCNLCEIFIKPRKKVLMHLELNCTLKCNLCEIFIKATYCRMHVELNCTLKCNPCEIFIKLKRVLALLSPCKDLLQATFSCPRVLIHYN